MTRKEAIETENMLVRLAKALDESLPRAEQSYSVARRDAERLRRIAMTLHRWSELECGIDSGGIDRDETTGKCWWYSSYSGKRTHVVPDRETGAKKRLTAIMARYPTLTAYIQGDPRGAPLYIIRPGDVPEGENVESYYSRGIAVHA